MATPAIHELDTTLHAANSWLKGVMQRLGTEDAHAGYAAMRATLHALRDRIGPGNAAHLGAQLPTLIRGVYYEGWHPAGIPPKGRHKQDFLEHVREELRTGSAIDPEAAAAAVFDVVCEKTSHAEAVKLTRLLPKGLRTLWPRDVRTEVEQQEQAEQKGA